jgi:hypothetical protein
VHSLYISGTALVQANELGINSIGYDVSAFNVLLCRAKTTKYDLVKVREDIIDIFNKARDLTQTNFQQPCLWKVSFLTYFCLKQMIGIINHYK